MFYSRRIAKDKGHVGIMEHAGFKARLMQAERLTGEHVHGLPPGEEIPVYPIATLPGCPKDWVREAGSYVCPVNVGWGLWFDFTMNDELNTAIVPSVKGMNPITGMKIDGLSLEQYIDKCPKHNKPFAHGKFCEECGYEWTKQNYIASPNILWWDGFRQPDGTVRQFFFSDEDKRDIASLVIGKENTVPAFGFAFWKTKIRREKPKINYRNYGGGEVIKPLIYGDQYHYNKTWTTDNSGCNNIFIGACSADNDEMQSEVQTSGFIGGGTQSCAYPKNINPPFTKKVVPRGILRQCKAVSVGAGAIIHQNLVDDSLTLEEWQDNVGGVIRLYFCFEEQFTNIVKSGGIKELKSNKQGYMEGLPVG